MQALLFSTLLLAMTALAYRLGRARALKVAAGNRRSLHSLAGYYGTYVALWSGAPALLLVAVWALFGRSLGLGEDLGFAGMLLAALALGLAGAAWAAPRISPTFRARHKVERAAMARGAPASVDGVYEKVVARETLEERARAIREIVRRGAHVLDIAPEDFSTAVVSKYLELKARGLL